jgi:Usher syndrome type-1G protein
MNGQCFMAHCQYRMLIIINYLDYVLHCFFFRQSVANALSLQDQISNHSSSESGSAKKQNSKKSRQRQRVISDSEDSDGTQNSSDESEEPNLPLKRFLAAYSLEEYFELLLKHQIDLETLMLLTDEDLKYLNLPLGPYRRLAVAIGERKHAFNNPGPMNDSRL